MPKIQIRIIIFCKQLYVVECNQNTGPRDAQYKKGEFFFARAKLQFI